MKLILFLTLFFLFSCSDDETEPEFKGHVNKNYIKRLHITYAYVDPTLESASINVMENGKLDIEGKTINVDNHEIKKRLERYFHPIHGGPEYFSIYFNMDLLPNNIYDILKTLIETLNKNKWKYIVVFFRFRAKPYLNIQIPVKFWSNCWGTTIHIKNWSNITEIDYPQKKRITYLELMNEIKNLTNGVQYNFILNREACEKNQILYLFSLLRELNEYTDNSFFMYQICLEL